MAEKGNEIAKYVAHLFHVVVQTYFGLFLILMLAPLISFIADWGAWRCPGVYHQLLGSFANLWIDSLSEVSMAKFVVLCFLAYPIGFVVSECGYRFGSWVGYHDKLLVEKDGFSVGHFAFRCWILRNPAEHRIWDWQLFQFEFCYYAEILFGFFSVALAVTITIPLLYYRSLTVLGAAFYGAVVIVAISVATWYLMRVARKSKLEDYRNVHEAVRKISIDRGQGAARSQDTITER